MARKKKQSDIPGILIVVGIVAYVFVKVAPILLAVGVIIMVVYLLVKVATYFADSSDHQGFRNRSQSHYSGTTQPRQSGGTQLSSVQTRQLQAPPQAPRTDRNTQKFNELMRKYTVTTVPSLSLQTDPLQVEMDEWECVEVLQAVNRIINQWSSVKI